MTESSPEPQAERTESQDVVAQAEELFSDTAKYVFDHYDADKDGLLSRKDFFTFLWELKAPPQTRLTEGQMMSCWKAVDEAQQGSINFDEFVKGVEICYERLFFAVENGVRPPEPVHIPPVDHQASQRALISNEPDPNSYNTVRFKKSVAVNFFETLLQEEASERELRQAEEADKRKKPALSSSSSSSITTTRREREREHVPAPAPAPVAATVTSPTAASTAAAGPMGRPLTSAAILAKQQQDREAKRLEAQRQMEKILAERHRAERERREAERQAKLDTERQRAEREVYQTEPSWKVALRNRATAK